MLMLATATQPRKRRAYGDGNGCCGPGTGQASGSCGGQSLKRRYGDEHGADGHVEHAGITAGNGRTFSRRYHRVEPVFNENAELSRGHEAVTIGRLSWANYTSWMSPGRHLRPRRRSPYSPRWSRSCGSHNPTDCNDSGIRSGN